MLTRDTSTPLTYTTTPSSATKVRVELPTLVTSGTTKVVRNWADSGRGDGAPTLMSVVARAVPKPSGATPVLQVESSYDAPVQAGSGAVAAKRQCQFAFLATNVVCVGVVACAGAEGVC